MKPDGTPTIEEILQMIDQFQEFEKRQLCYRLRIGGNSTVMGRYNFPNHAYPYMTKRTIFTQPIVRISERI